MAPEVQTETAPQSATAILESMTPEQRQDWQVTGKTPEAPKVDTSAASEPPAIVAKSEPGKPAEAAPAPDTGKAVQEPEKGKTEDHVSRGDKRILQLLAERKALQAENEELRRPKEQVPADPKAESAPAKPSTPATVPESLKAKIAAVVEKADEFETYEDMVAAITAESIRAMTPEMILAVLKEEGPKAFKEFLKQETEAKEANKAREKVTTAWMKSVNEAAARHDDYQKVVDSPAMAELIPLQSALNSIIVDSEMGGEILYHLATHHDEIRRISALGPIAQAREIFKLETTLSGTPAQETTEVPPPPKTIGTGETVPSDAETAARDSKDAGAYIKAANERETRERVRLRK